MKVGAVLLVVHVKVVGPFKIQWAGLGKGIGLKSGVELAKL